MNTKYIITIILSVSFLLSSCSGGTNSWDDTIEAGTSQTYANAEDAIADMKQIDWETPDIYNDVLVHCIRERQSLGATDRIALESALNDAYADQLIRTCSNILSSECSDRHTTLHAAYKEYEEHDFGGYVPVGVQEMKDAYSLHNEQLKFSISSSYGVGLKSCLDSYNGTYDSQKRKEAQDIRATNPTCKQIQDAVSESRINEVLAQRKQNYYAALASKFCRTSNPSMADYNRLYSILGGAKNAAALRKKIDAHWEAIENAQTNATIDI